MLSKALEVLSEAPDAMLTALALMWRLPVLGKALHGAGRIAQSHTTAVPPREVPGGFAHRWPVSNFGRYRELS